MHTCTHNHTHMQMQHTNMHLHLCTQHYTHNTMCTQDGYFPLYVASQKGHDRIVEILLHAGATVDLQNKVKDRYYLFICHLCCAMRIIHCTLCTTQHSGECVGQKKISNR